MLSSLRDLEGSIENKWQDLLKLLLLKVCERFNGKEIQLGLAHWDFAPWNTCLNDKKRLVVFDWEWASFTEPPLIDFYHFVIRTEGAVRAKKGNEILLELLDEKGHYSELINRYKDTLNHDIFFDRIGFLLIYLYKASILYLNFEKLRKQIGFVNKERVQLLSILRPMLERIVEIE